MSTRSVPSGTSRKRAIHGVVISAATVILSTATSASNGGSHLLAGRARSAGSASLPVTNEHLAGSRRCRLPTVGSPGRTHLFGVPSSAPPVRPPQHDLLDLPRELEVLVGDPAGGVVLQLHR